MVFQFKYESVYGSRKDHITLEKKMKNKKNSQHLVNIA